MVYSSKTKRKKIVSNLYSSSVTTDFFDMPFEDTVYINILYKISILLWMISSTWKNQEQRACDS
jgi:hypothetical protein